MIIQPKVLDRAASIAPPFHLSWWRWLRLSVLMLLDVAAFGLSYYFAFVLRMDSFVFSEYAEVFWHTVPWFVLVHLIVYSAMGVYKQVWRFANIDCALLVAKSSIVAMVTFLVLCNFLGIAKWPPRSVPVIALLLIALVTISIKFSWRLWLAFQKSIVGDSRESCFIYGAGSAGELLARHISANRNFPYAAFGFIDDDTNKARRVLHGLKIYGTRNDLAVLVKAYDIKTVLIAIHHASGKTLREIVSVCQSAGVRPLIVPDISQNLDLEIVKPRAVDIKDLLKRSPKSTDTKLVSSFFRGVTVLVTGAGGSIGSELCHQILSFGPSKVIMLDSSEFNLYRVNKELSDRSEEGIQVIPVLGSALNDRLVRSVFEEHRPTVVLHAAAYKHVYLVEVNSLEGITNNILATKVLTSLAVEFGTKHFLLISTDKAVRPTSVMGATKRCCELIVQHMHEKYGEQTSFCSVRFGNVLGSSGSVVPRFLEQIQNGGPVTVTHPEVTRYFMLISEAVGLVLQAISMSKGGEIFVLNMGEPVKILDMAIQLVHLAGKVPYQDIDIAITGLVPGEKLYEELILEGSEERTLHDDIFVTIPQMQEDDVRISGINELLGRAMIGDERAAKRQLWDIIKYDATRSSKSGIEQKQVSTSSEIH